MAKLSPINDWHQATAAKMADFGGWLMPIEYPKIDKTELFTKHLQNQISLPIMGGVLAEHKSVRTNVGLFDVSHLGKLEVKLECPNHSDASNPAEGCETLTKILNEIFTNDLTLISDGQAQYNLILNDQGKVIDDLIIYRLSSHHFFLVPNASNCTAVEMRMKKYLAEKNNDIKLENLHEQYCVFAIQGPYSQKILQALWANLGLGEVPNLEYMSFAHLELENSKDSKLASRVILCRTGYTGEFGYELITRNENAKLVWELLASLIVANDGKVVGLGARDTLRTEMGYPLHGHEISEEISPLEGGASWAVKINKDFFLGKPALVTQKDLGIKRKLVALEFEGRTIARAGMSVKNEVGEEVGIVTSGTFSPSLNKGISLALVDRKALNNLGAISMLQVEIRGRLEKANLASLPFVPSHVR